MNKVIIFSDSPAVLKHFSSLSSSKQWSIQQISHSELRKVLKKPEEQSIYYSDYASIPQEEKQKDLSYLLKKNNIARGVIDRKNEITDSAELLMKGCDYIGSRLLKADIKPARITKYRTFFKNSMNDAESTPAPPQKQIDVSSGHIIAEKGWSGVKSGKEYTFLMLFVEMSLPAEWKKKSGDSHLNEIKQNFHSVVERHAAAHDGKVWIWNEYGGLVLFPFDGISCMPILPAIRLLMNRALISIEDFGLHSPIRVKASMHLGTTTWKARGKTGTIISDSLNSIFHLGTRYTTLNDLDITEDVYSLLVPGLKNLFYEAGSFEGRKIFRLCHINVSD